MISLVVIMTKGIFLLLGSNLGDKESNLNTAKSLIEQYAGKIISKSSLYRTTAWGKEDQPEFYNQVIEIVGELTPEELIEQLLYIENKMGRQRKEKWGERLIDLDILYYHETIIGKTNLKIPHPGIPERRFTLVPLEEIAPNFKHPLLKKTNSQLLTECADPLQVFRIL